MSGVLVFAIGLLVGLVAFFPPLVISWSKDSVNNSPTTTDLNGQIDQLSHEDKNKIAERLCEMSHCSSHTVGCLCVRAYISTFPVRPEILADKLQKMSTENERIKEEVFKAKTVEFDPYDTFLVTLVAKVKLYKRIMTENGVVIPPDSELVLVPLKPKRQTGFGSDPWSFIDPKVDQVPALIDTLTDDPLVEDFSKTQPLAGVGVSIDPQSHRIDDQPIIHNITLDEAEEERRRKRAARFSKPPK